jgi:hypothetical protein
LAELFHYTTRDFAEEALRDIEEPGVAAEIWDGTYGPGFYALDLAPGDASRDELRFECFGDARQDHPMDGVLVLEADFSEPPFEFQAGHIWLMPGDVGNPASIGHMIVGVGLFDEDEEAWSFSET